MTENLNRSDQEIKDLEKRVRKFFKDSGNPARASTVIANAKMDVEYKIGKCNGTNFKLWQYHYFETLKSKI